MASRTRRAFSTLRAVMMRSGVRIFCPVVSKLAGSALGASHLDGSCAGGFGSAQPIGVHRRDGCGAGEHHAQGLGDRRHRARGSHHPTGPRRGREPRLDRFDLVGVDLSTAEAGPETPAVRAGAESLTAVLAGEHGPGHQLDRGPVGRERSHQLGGDGLVAAAEQHHGVHRLGADHLLGVHRHQVAEHQAGGVQKDLTQRDRGKGQRQAARGQHAPLHRFDQLREVPMAVVEVAGRVGDADDGALEQLARVAHRAREGAAQVEREVGVPVAREALL